MNKREFALIVIPAAALAAASFILQGRIDLNFSDEGFLWYGSWRTALGELPLRDFRSYQPGRYFWSAGWSFVFGQGIVGLRASIAVFQGIGLAFGLAAVRRVTRSWIMLWAIGILFTIWMYPFHKMFEHSLVMILLYTGTLFLEKPTLRRHFGIGVAAGVMAMFGETHAFSAVIATFGLILFTWFQTGRSGILSRLSAWAAGIAAGYAPMLILFVFAPGFFESFVGRISHVLLRDTLNLPLPVPWPWILFRNAGFLPMVHAFSMGVFFVLLPAFAVTVGIYLLRKKHDLQLRAPLIASLFVLIPYISYSFSRADINHLTFSMHPLLLGILSLPRLQHPRLSRLLGAGRLQRAGTFSALLVLSFFAVAIKHPLYTKWRASPGDYVEVRILDDQIWLNKNKADLIQTMHAINAGIGPGERLLIAPHWPALYPVLQRESPWWDIYVAWNTSENDQVMMIAALQSPPVQWIVLGDESLGGTYKLVFRETHPEVWEYIHENYVPIENPGLPQNFQLLHKKSD